MFRRTALAIAAPVLSAALAVGLISSAWAGGQLVFLKYPGHGGWSYSVWPGWYGDWCSFSSFDWHHNMTGSGYNYSVAKQTNIYTFTHGSGSENHPNMDLYWARSYITVNGNQFWLGPFFWPGQYNISTNWSYSIYQLANYGGGSQQMALSVPNADASGDIDCRSTSSLVVVGPN